MKIFVTTGTSSFPFKRLIKEVLEIAKDKYFINDSFLIQGTKDKEKNGNIQKIPSLSYKEMKSWFRKADIVITHGGLASIFLSWQLNKKAPIVVPRLKIFKEHVNDHQLLFTSSLAKKNKIIIVKKIDDLKKAIINYKKLHLKSNYSLENKKEQRKLIKNLIAYTEDLK